MANPHPIPHWKKGQSGNPHGRPPKDCSITDTFRRMMNRQPEIKKAIATKILELALKKDDLQALKLVWQYMDGMPNQQFDVNGDLNQKIESSSLDKIADSIKSIMEIK